MSPHWKCFHSEEIFWGKEIKLKPSPCLPNLSHCRPGRLSRALLTDRGDTARGRGASAHWLSVRSLLLVSSFACTCVIASLGWDHTLPSQSLLLPSPELSMRTHTVSLSGTHERTNVYLLAGNLFCICC